MSDLTPPEIEGAAELTERLGEWPDFHDAEILEIRLHREEPSWLHIQLPQVSRGGAATVTFTLEGVSDLELADFSSQNVISSLDIAAQPTGYRLSLFPCFGVSGFIEAEQIRVSYQSEAPK